MKIYLHKYLTHEYFHTRKFPYLWYFSDTFYTFHLEIMPGSQQSEKRHTSVFFFLSELIRAYYGVATVYVLYTATSNSSSNSKCTESSCTSPKVQPHCCQTNYNAS